MSAQQINQINLRVGERHVVRLEGLGAAGYEWMPEIEGEGVSVEKVRDPSQEEVDPGSMPAGQSFPEAFRIEGRAPGRATIRFLQRRPWEAGAPPANEHVIHVEVR